MQRRDLLATLSAGAIGLVAGCTGGDCIGSGTTVRFEPVDASAIADHEAPSVQDRWWGVVAELFERLLAGEERTIEHHGERPIYSSVYAQGDGQFFEIEPTRVDSGRVTGPEYTLSRDPDADEPPATDALAFADLPPQDRWRVAEAIGYEVERVEGLRITTSVVAGYLREEAVQSSTLAGGVDASALEFEDTSVSLERTGEGTASADLVRYEAGVVAEDAAAFADRVLERRGAELRVADDDVRELLAAAEAEAADGHSLSVCTSVREDADEELFRRRDAVYDLEETLEELAGTDERHPEYVRYEGEWYRIRISSWAV